jgi:hypothetical protein
VKVRGEFFGLREPLIQLRLPILRRIRKNRSHGLPFLGQKSVPPCLLDVTIIVQDALAGPGSIRV